MGVHGVSTVNTPLPCSATGSDHLSLCVYRHLLMPPVREAWRPQRLFHGHFTPCPLPLAPFSSVPRNAATNCDKLSDCLNGFSLTGCLQKESFTNWLHHGALTTLLCRLFARYVMPRFQGSLVGSQASNQWASARKEALQVNRIAGLKRATDAYYGQRQ